MRLIILTLLLFFFALIANAQSAFSSLANSYAKSGNFEKAVEYEKHSIEMIESIIGKNNIDYINSLSNLALYYAKLGNYQEALRIGSIAMKICKEVLGENHPYYASSLSNLAAYYSYLGNYQKAIDLVNLALKIEKEFLGDNQHPSHAISLCNLATYYSYLGNYQEALRIGTIAMNIFKEIRDEVPLDYATSLNAISTYHSGLGNYQEAIRLSNLALEIRKEILGDKHPDCARSLSNLASYHSGLGNNQEAIRLSNLALEIRKEILGDKHPDYARSLLNLATYNSNLGNYKEAARLGAIATEILKENLGDKHPDYIQSNISLSLDYFLLKDKNNLKSTILSVYPIAEQNLKSNFTYLPKSERQLFWNKNNYQFNIIHTYAATYPDEDFLKCGYNSILLTKGILLNSEWAFTKLLSESGSENMCVKYNQIRNLRMQLNKLYEKPIALRNIDTDSLGRNANELERQLMHESLEFGLFTKNLSVRMEDVQNKLGKSDAAIEFVSFPTINRDSIMYMAYILKKDLEVPTLVKLFEEKELSNMSDHDIYSTANASKLIWEKLQPKLKDTKNVYFAPIGILHQIAIEYLPDYEKEGLISNKYNIYRLSSTRELALIKQKPSNHEAVIYGGIKYDSNIKPTESKSTKHKARGTTSFYVNVDSLPTRSHYEYLEFTLKEGFAIDSIMEIAKYNSQLILGDNATEESFKSLSGLSKEIIHLATHGFYWNRDEAEYRAHENSKLLFMSTLGIYSQRNDEDLALSRTGLLMAGANNILRGKEIPENIEDGIMTAKEIADLSFKNLDLVVLSACQTGMGDISRDGVFGLQRGFKNAGANSILMSLWEVNDKATQILMTEFYKNYLGGKSKRESLLAAQKAVRETPGFEDPEYWAAFILLDGLN